MSHDSQLAQTRRPSERGQRFHVIAAPPPPSPPSPPALRVGPTQKLIDANLLFKMQFYAFISFRWLLFCFAFFFIVSNANLLVSNAFIIEKGNKRQMHVCVCVCALGWNRVVSCVNKRMNHDE